MKKVLLTIGLVLFSIVGLNSKETSNLEQKILKKSNNITKAPQVTCYRIAIDDFGNEYYVRVTCPKKVILK